jgi:hypothetical protein
MTNKICTFKIPNKTSRLRAIGNISKLPDDSFKKILKTGENSIILFMLLKKMIGYLIKKKIAKLLINFYMIEII